jgi:ribosomal protein S12 methylthiotransferase accessory factor
MSGATDEAVTTVLATLRAAGIEPVVKLASTEFACVVYCVGDDHDPDASPIALSAIGEAAHPDRDVAVSKALLEFASSRARRNFAFGPLADVARLSPDYWTGEQRRPTGPQEVRALQAMTEWTQWDLPRMRTALAPLFRCARTVPLETLPTQPTNGSAELLRLLLDRLAGFDVLVVPAPDQHDGIVAVKVLAPGLEVETLSYLRIGERAYQLLLEQDRGLVGPGPPNRPGRIAVRLTAAARDRLGGPIWIDATAAAAAVGTLYPLYREPRRHAVQRATGPVG